MMNEQEKFKEFLRKARQKNMIVSIDWAADFSGCFKVESPEVE